MTCVNAVWCKSGVSACSLHSTEGGIQTAQQSIIRTAAHAHRWQHVCHVYACIMVLLHNCPELTQDESTLSLLSLAVALS